MFSGLSHPDVGHPAELCYLTSAPHPRADNFNVAQGVDGTESPILLRNPQIAAGLFVAGFQVERHSEFFGQPQGQDRQRVVE